MSQREEEIEEIVDQYTLPTTLGALKAMFREMVRSGYDKGYTHGYEKGYDEGRETGWNDGAEWGQVVYGP